MLVRRRISFRSIRRSANFSKTTLIVLAKLAGITTPLAIAKWMAEQGLANSADDLFVRIDLMQRIAATSRCGEELSIALLNIDAF